MPFAPSSVLCKACRRRDANRFVKSSVFKKPKCFAKCFALPKAGSRQPGSRLEDVLADFDFGWQKMAQTTHANSGALYFRLAQQVSTSILSMLSCVFGLPPQVIPCACVHYGAEAFGVIHSEAVVRRANSRRIQRRLAEEQRRAMNLVAMASNLIAMASNLIVIASIQVTMASTLVAIGKFPFLDAWTASVSHVQQATCGIPTST